MGNSTGSRANNINFPGSDKLTEVQFYMLTSCQPGSRVIRALSGVEKPLLFSDLAVFQRQRKLGLAALLISFTDTAVGGIATSDCAPPCKPDCFLLSEKCIHNVLI